MSRPKVAVVTRTKDRPLLLPRALKSIQSQTFKDYVWIVVNDGGDPEPVTEVTAQAKRDGLSVIQINNAKSCGMEAASNLGCKASQSDYIVIHDDDDTWEPDYLKETTSFLDNNNHYAGVVTGTNQIDEKMSYGEWTVLEKKPYNTWVRAIYMVDMLQKNMFPPIAFTFRREIYDQVGGFDETLPVLGDWDFALKVLVKSDIGYHSVPLANYHLRPPEHQSKDAYANTVTHFTDVHSRYDAIIRNKWMRQDLAAGEFGLGTLLGLGRQHNAMWTVLWAYREKILEMKK